MEYIAYWLCICPIDMKNMWLVFRGYNTLTCIHKIHWLEYAVYNDTKYITNNTFQILGNFY